MTESPPKPPKPPKPPNSPNSPGKRAVYFSPVKGTIREFDSQRGIGALKSENNEEFAFHCVSISDGSRHIEVGSEVVCLIGPGRLAAMEATCIVKVADPRQLDN